MTSSSFETSRRGPRRLASGEALGRDIAGAVREALSRLDRGVAAGRPKGQSNTLKIAQVDRATRALQLGANGQLRLENISGDITITAGAGRSATIEIVRQSHGRTAADAKLGLDRVRADVTDGNGRATVKETYPSDAKLTYSVDVEYHVTAPAGTAVSTHTMSGDVTVTGIRGDLSIDTISGDVRISDAGAIANAHTVSGDVTITGVQTDGAVSASTTSGTVTARQIKARRVTLESFSDDLIATDVTADVATLHSFTGDITFTGALTPRGRYEFQTQSGDVALHVDGHVGFEFDAKTVAGAIHTDLTLQVTGTVARGIRRSLHGTFGDGSASLAVTTFSGDIVLGEGATNGNGGT